MKKLLTILTLCAGFLSAHAQDDEGRVKNFNFGLKIIPSLSYIKPHLDNKTFKNNGAVPKFGYGLITDFRLSKVISVSTGLEVFNSGGKVNFVPNDSAFYMFVPEGAAQNLATKFYPTTRKMSLTYVDLPLTFKMKTPEIGNIKYFGVFGTNLSVRAKARATDEGWYQTGTIVVSGIDNKNVNIQDQISLMRLALNVGLGAEYNLVGSTSLVFSLNYLQGYTNTLKKNSNAFTSLKKPIVLKAFNNAFAATVGVIF